MTSFAHDQSKDQAGPQRRAATPAAGMGAGPALHPILRLQRLIGNARVARMLAQRHESAPESEGAAAGGLIQAAPEVGLEGGPISDELSSSIQGQRGSGSTLDDTTRGTMEQGFGTDFSDVRVHTDSTSHDLNDSVSARAFTTGNDIFLGRDASPSDSDLMAHELTHVVQQRSMNVSGPMTVSPAGDSYEQEADAASAAINRQIASGSTQRATDEQAE